VRSWSQNQGEKKKLRSKARWSRINLSPFDWIEERIHSGKGGAWGKDAEVAFEEMEPSKLPGEGRTGAYTGPVIGRGWEKVSKKKRGVRGSRVVSRVSLKKAGRNIL